jgi:Cu(I)/Ag(I) efflux system membrane fusion protein/cobalt-zinc-cadmium efflux system membrane fusion protein
MSAKQWISLSLVAAAAAAAGWLASDLRTRGEDGAGPDASPCAGGAAPLYWKAPMDPTYVRDAPGKSPMGMDLVPECHDERRVAHVHTKVQGWVEQLRVDYEGQMVEKGQPLLEIYSPELVATQEELLLASRYRGATAESPYDDVRESGAHLFEATRRRLELWDIPDRDIDRLLETGTIRKNLTLYSPAKGVVTHLMVREGMEVSPNQNLYTIADLSRVWVYADVYEYELPWVGVGQKAVAELSYLQGREFEGAVTYVYPFLDPKTRTARVRLEMDNPEIVLKPDMFANVRIETETRVNTLVVPDEAVLRSGRRNLAILALGGGRFEPREVTLGLDSGDGWLEVREGLGEGESAEDVGAR